MSVLHITIYERRVGGEVGLIIGAVTGTFSVPSTSGLTGPALPCFRVFLSSPLFSFSFVLAWFVWLFLGLSKHLLWWGGDREAVKSGMVRTTLENEKTCRGC
jgi:hypothetical protein